MGCPPIDRNKESDLFFPLHEDFMTDLALSMENKSDSLQSVLCPAGTEGLFIFHCDTMVALFCSGLSGGAALMYEVLWNRAFLTLTGSTTLATASVLAAFLGGLALGSWVIGSKMPRIRHPYRFYALAEILIAVWALTLQEALPQEGGWLYAAVWPLLKGVPVLQDLLNLGMGALFLGPAAFLMGSTFPLLLATMNPSRSSGKAGILYAVNALGGVAGSLLAGFATLPRLGMNGTLLIAVSLNLMAGILGFFALSRRSGKRERVGVCDAETTLPYTIPVRQPDKTLVLVLLGVSGIVSLGLEIVWTRLLVLMTGSSTYAFSLLTAVAILGIAAGSSWVSAHVDRLRSPRLVLAHMELGVLIACILALSIFQRLPSLLLEWLGTIGFSYPDTLAVNGGMAILILFPSFFLFGALFPVAVRLLKGDGESPDRPAAHVYAALGFGNMIGAWVIPAILVPRFGLQGSVEFLGLIGLGVGAILAMGLRESPRQRAGTLIAGGIMGLVLFFAPSWHPLLMTAGIYREAPVYWNLLQEGVPLRQILSSYRLLYYREGIQTTVSVVERPSLGLIPYRLLAVDGKVDASTGADMNTEILSGHIPLLLRPSSRHVLVIGLASGVTAGAVEQHASVEKLTVAEIEPAVVRAAQIFRDSNQGALEDPRLHLVLDDGRHYLSYTRQVFDVIVSEPSNPWMSGPSRLFTREFFQTAKSHLSPGGLFAQWLPLYGLPSRLLKAEIRTFLDIYPHALLFQVAQGDLLLVGSRFPLHRWSRSRLSLPVRADFDRLKLTPPEVWGMLVAGSRGLREWTGKGPLNTDQNGLLEFGSPPYLLDDTLTKNRRELERIHWKSDLSRWVRNSGDEPEDHAAYALSRIALLHHKPERADFLAHLISDQSKRHELLGRLANDRGEFRVAEDEWTASGDPASRRLLAKMALEDGQGDRACRLLFATAEDDADFRNAYLLGLAFMEEGKNREALSVFLKETPGISDSQHILLPYLTAIVEQRQGDLASAQRSFRVFRHLLDRLREEREEDRGNRRMNVLLKRVQRFPKPALKDDERNFLTHTLQGRLLVPLGLYFHGVTLLWTGHTSNAVNVLNDYLNRLPPRERSASHAVVLLKEARQHTTHFLTGSRTS